MRMEVIQVQDGLLLQTKLSNMSLNDKNIINYKFSLKSNSHFDISITETLVSSKLGL